MNEDKDRDASAFAGNPDMPPAQPDQPAERNQELEEDQEEPAESQGELKDEDFPSLPGYG